MTIDLTLDDEQQMLAGSVRSFVARDCPPSRVRAAEGGHDAGLWETIAAAGWPGIALPEPARGAGRGLLDLAVVCEGLGRGAVPSPLISTVTTAALPILWAGTEEQQRRWLPPLACGDRIGGLAVVESAKALVTWAQVADLLVVTTADGLHVLDAAELRGVRVTPHVGLGVEPIATVELDGMTGEPLGVDSAEHAVVLERALDHAAVASLAYAVGVMEAMLTLSVEHARERHQFGRAIGSFQAVAHRCVDMRTDIDACRYLAYQAAWALDRGDLGGVEVTAALSYGLDAARRVAMHAHQVHGAIGFSTEHDLHLYTRRAKAFELGHGPAARHRERLATAMGLGGDRVKGFAAVLGDWARRQPDKTAVVEDAHRLTYAELDARVDALAAELQHRGVQPGDVVSSQLPNGVASMVLCFAAGRVGAIHNPIIPIYREREVGFIRTQADPAVFFADADEVLGVDAGPPGVPVDAEPDAPRFLLYTSGSSADPKGVLHSDGTLLAECGAQAAYHRMGADEVFVMPSPVAHVSGLLYGILLPVLLGATSVLMPAWDAGRFLELVEAEGGTFCGGATPFLQGVVDHPDLERFDVSSLRLFPCGGADVPPDLIRRAIARLGVRSGRGYGSTEFPSITSSAGPDEPDDKRAETDGRPIGENQIRIHDGEIQARGPELFLGYRDSMLDADVFTADGWYRTGDAGVLDRDGYLTVTGRLKDIVIRQGEKISARELEDLLDEHPKVGAAAVVAVPDDRTGERACAFIVPREPADAPTLAELCEFLVEQQLSRRKLPEQLELVETLPMTASGKVDKRELRARSGTGGSVRR